MAAWSASGERFRFALLEAWLDLVGPETDISVNEIYNSPALQAKVIQSLTDVLANTIDATVNNSSSEDEEVEIVETIITHISSTLRQHRAERRKSWRSIAGDHATDLAAGPTSIRLSR